MSKNEIERNWIVEFQELWQKGINHIVKATQIYVQAIDADPNNRILFTQEFEGIIPASAWKRFEEVGRGMVHPKLLMGQAGCYENKIRRLPFAIQRAIIDGEKFELLLENQDVLKVDVRTVTSNQAKQLFDKDHIRSVAEQKTWMADPSNKKIAQQEEAFVPYVIRGGKLHITRPTWFTKQQWRNIGLEF